MVEKSGGPVQLTHVDIVAFEQIPQDLGVLEVLFVLLTEFREIVLDVELAELVEVEELEEKVFVQESVYFRQLDLLIGFSGQHVLLGHLEVFESLLHVYVLHVLHLPVRYFLPIEQFLFFLQQLLGRLLSLFRQVLFVANHVQKRCVLSLLEVEEPCQSVRDELFGFLDVSTPLHESPSQRLAHLAHFLILLHSEQFVGLCCFLEILSVNLGDSVYLLGHI